MRRFRLEVLKKRSKWYFRLVARNGNTLMHSECYSSKYKATQSAKSIYRSMDFIEVLFTED